MGVLTEIWEAIPVYTGLAPITFFTLLAVVVAAYYLLSALLAPPPFKYVPMEPLPEPVQLGTVSAEELSAYDGNDASKPLLMAIKGNIYDVSQSKGFYGPGGPYALFAGKDASKALAKMSFEKEDLTGDTTGLGSYELSILDDWEFKFQTKYHKVGELPKSEASPVEETSRDVPATVEEPVPESFMESKAEE